MVQNSTRIIVVVFVSPEEDFWVLEAFSIFHSPEKYKYNATTLYNLSSYNTDLDITGRFCVSQIFFSMQFYKEFTGLASRL